MSSITETSSVKEDRERPFHVLMLGPDEQYNIRDPKLDSDYLARRQKCLKEAKKSDESVAKVEPDENDEEEALWSGASPLERALVGCCDVDGGGISQGKEVTFLGLIARHCHTTASQALALAILQRTVERPTEENDDESSSDEDDYSSEYSSYSDDDESEASTEEKKTEPSKDSENKNGKKSSKEAEEEEVNRISPFLAAGGLQTLRDWLVDATTPVTTLTPRSSSPRSSSPTPNKKSRSSSPTPADASITNPPTGPILLPLLSLLESIPFHKKLVTETKINKNIRNLKRQLDEAVPSFDVEKKRNANGDTLKLEEWRHAAAGGNVVVQVQKAVEALMQSWQKKAKDSTGKPEPENPFASLQDKLRERLGMLLEYEENHDSKPEWLARMEDSDQTAKKSPPSSGKLTTHQLEALEHKKERERIRDAMQKTQQERQEAKDKLEQLKRKFQEQNQKRKAEKQMNVEKKRRKVQWKDGLNNSVNLRRRHLLEVVHEYPADPREDGPETKLGSNDKENVENEANGKALRQQDNMLFDDMDGVPLADGDENVHLTNEAEVKSEGPEDPETQQSQSVL